MIAANASIIWANRLSTIGSIGVYSIFLDISEALKANGLIYHLVSSGDLKGAEMPEIPKASAFLEWEQRNINDIFDWIKANIPRQVPEEMMRGGVVLGERALELNLVNKLYTDISEVLSQEQPIEEAQLNDTTQEDNEDTVEQEQETLEEMTEEEVSLHNVEATKGIKALCADGQDIPHDIGKALLLRFRNMKPQEFNNYIKSMVK
jgi:ClpP class serine protease